MQVGEHDRSQLGSRRPGRCEPVAEPADQRLDDRSVAEETRSKPGVDDGVSIAGLHEHAVVAAGDRGPVPALRRQGGLQFVVRHPAAGVKNAASSGSHGGVIWPSLITAQLRRPTVNR